MKDTEEYITYADSDYFSAKRLYDTLDENLSLDDELSITNSVTYMCSKSVERYLKYIIDKKIECENEQEQNQQDKLLRTHNIKKLTDYVSYCYPEYKKELKFLELCDGFYFTTQYPSDNSIFANKEHCKDALECCKVSQYLVSVIVDNK